MKNVCRIIIKIIEVFIILSFMLFFTHSTYAIQHTNHNGINDIKNPLESPNEYNPITQSEDLNKNSNFYKIANIFIGAIRVIGSFASVLILIMLGIKFLLGSIEEKAQYKESFIPYIIGCILVFFISQILGLLHDFAFNHINWNF